MDDALKTQVVGLGLSVEQVEMLAKEGVSVAADMALLSADEIKSITGCGLIIAKKVAAAFTVAVPAGGMGAGGVPPGNGPILQTDVPGFAAQLGVDPGLLTMMMFTGFGADAGMSMDMSSLVPVQQIIGGYNPKNKNIAYMIMGQVESRLSAGPIIAINADGSVNAEVTAQYIMALEDGFPPADDGVYYSSDTTPYELIKVGVDAQSIYDADPLDSMRALQKNGMGIGRIAWKDVSGEVRQLIYYATHKTGEINPKNESDQQWLRDNIKPTSKRLELRLRCPQANVMWNESNRTGTLPTLRVQIARSARRQQIMPSRRSALPRDLSGKGGATSGSDMFRENE